MAASSISPSRYNVDTRDSGALDALRPTDGVTVMMDGRISLQHIGDIEVVGITLTDLANLLKKF